MNNCIFAAHCMESYCDESCPIYTEISYLLELNKIDITNPVLMSTKTDIEKAVRVLDNSYKQVKIVKVSNTIAISNLITYCAICQNWKGNMLHANVYNLKFSSYIENEQKSFSSKAASDQLEYERIWIEHANTLIISSLDFVQFKDYKAQVLLNLIHNRINDNLTTILVCPRQSLLGDAHSTFFNRLNQILSNKEAILAW